MIGLDFFKALVLRPDAAGDEVVRLSVFHLLGHLTQDILADDTDIIAVRLEQGFELNKIARLLVQRYVTAILTGTACIDGGFKADCKQSVIIAKNLIMCVHSDIPVIFTGDIP